MFGAFAVFLVGQSLTGWQHLQRRPSRSTAQTRSAIVSYLTTGHFVEATFENWESEFLQMAAYVVLTVWLVQKGSSESKPLEGDDALDDDPRDAAATRRRARAGPPRGLVADALRELPGPRVRGPVPRCRSSCTRSAGPREYNAEQLAHGSRRGRAWASS